MLETGELAATPHWANEDWAEIWQVFRRQALHMLAGGPALRPAREADPVFRAVCVAASEASADLGHEASRSFFEQHFLPTAIAPEVRPAGFLTGFYEPVVDGSLVRTAAFTAPLLPRPDDLVTLAPDCAAPAVPAGFTAGRRAPDGSISVYPERATLEDFALSAAACPVAWLKDWVEVFLVQVQGSARVKLADGSERRLTYAGRNGHPYTSIGRMLIDSGRIAPDAMTLDTLKGWLRQHGQAVGEEGRRIMQQNRSYIFFRADAVDVSAAGPTGGAGVPLTPLRSIAVDRSLWCYGLPFWIESEAPIPGFGAGPLRRLFIAEDTGSAILGAARADLFLGSGEDAGRNAGGVRHPARFTALLPRRR